MRDEFTFSLSAFETCPIVCRMFFMGQDLNIAVYGGSHPHIGSTVLAQARPSLTGEGFSATSSVLNCMGHKDEAIARKWAETIAKQSRCTTVCTCGIHIEDAAPEELLAISDACEQLLKQCLQVLNTQSGNLSCKDIV